MWPSDLRIIPFILQATELKIVSITCPEIIIEMSNRHIVAPACDRALKMCDRLNLFSTLHLSKLMRIVASSALQIVPVCINFDFQY